MIHHREPLDAYDMRPEAMVAYLRYNGWHFNKPMAEWAASQMRKLNTATGKMERIEPWTKDEVDAMLTENNVTVENNTGYDMYYVANMAKADFYKSSLPTKAEVAKYIKDVVDDADQADGFILNRFYADTVRNGQPIPWRDLI